MVARMKRRDALEAINPATARTICAKLHPKQRPLRDAKVEAYAQTMVAGKWDTTHQGIAISDEGYLLDGHHRLQAVIRSGLTITFLVTRGLDADTFKNMDGGIPRTTS